MSRDIYASTAGASAAWSQLDMIGNNLANASTTGFKAGRVTFSVTGPGDSPEAEAYVQTGPIRPIMTDGAMRKTDDDFHVALSGPGFLSVQVGSETLLTRDGQLALDPDGRLVTRSGGYPVLGEGGEISLVPGERMRIGEDGTVVGSESGEIGKLQLLTGAATQAGGNLWRPQGATTAAEGTVVQQGFLEESNVDAMQSMVQLIEASRFFEAYQKAMQASDEADERLIRTGGR